MTTRDEDGGYLILQIRLLNGRLFNRLLAEDGRALYSAEQGKILSCLWRWAPLTATEIAQKTWLANNTLTAMLGRLESQGLVRSAEHPQDRRKRLFDVTELGRSQESIGAAVSAQLGAIFWQGFSADEIAATEHYLARILRNLQEAEKKS